MAHSARQKVPLPIRRPSSTNTGVIHRPGDRPHATASPHDPLHMQPGLMYCWCKCPHCWDPLAVRCICLQCPDNGGRGSTTP